MEYLGKIENSKDLVNKEYIDSKISSGGSGALFALYRGELNSITTATNTFKASQLPSENCIPLFATWVDYETTGMETRFKNTGFCELQVDNITGDWYASTYGRQSCRGYIIVVGVDLNKL